MDRRAVFLDRDGTLIHDRHYLADPEGVELVPGGAGAVRRLNESGIPVLLVTNQSGIGRGLFSESDFRAVQARLADLLSSAGARLDGVYHCPHAPDREPPCLCRKPAPGLFVRAAREHGVDPARSFFIGDRERDVVPGVELGGTGLLISPSGAVRLNPEFVVVASLADAVERVLQGSRSD